MSQQFRRSLLVTVARAGLAAMLVTGVTGAPKSLPSAAAATTPATVEGGDLKVIVPELPATYGNVKNPTWTIGVTGYLFPAVETLIGLSAQGPVPTKLATSWDIAQDGKSITFHLRQGVKFHDGTDFNAAAVKWNLDKIRSGRSELKPITSIDVIDDHTVRFNLSSYTNTLLYNLTWYDGLMISPASVEGRDPTFIATHVIGTGPFVLDSFKQNTSAVFKKFADYWDKGKPHLDQFEYLVVNDSNTARSALQSGQAQAWDYVDPKDLAPLKSSGYLVSSVPGVIRTAYGDSANADFPFSKPQVRLAIDYAIDKAAIVKVFGAGTWEAPPGPCSVRQIGCEAATANERKYDPAMAKKLLAEAGYPNGFKTSILSKSTVSEVVLAAIQAYLKAVGIDADIEILDSPKAASVATQGWKNGIFVQGLGVSSPSFIQALEVDGPAPTKAYSAAAPAGYFDLLKKADAATDDADQKKLSEQLVTMLQTDGTYAPWYVESRNAVYSSKVHLDLDTISLQFWNPGDAWMGH